MAGNVATPKAFEDLSEWGADSIRVGVGGGATCSTRIVTGHGMPNFSAVMACAHSSGTAKIVADGGIKNSGDMVKALAGADVAMLGTALAGTAEAPGEIVNIKGKSYKKIRGRASKEAQNAWRGKVSVAEGVSHQVPYKGELAKVLHELTNGLKSGLSYSGCTSLSELHNKAESYANLLSIESRPHVFELSNGKWEDTNQPMGKQTVRKLYAVVPDGMYANLVSLLKFDGFRFSQLMRILLDAYVNDPDEIVKYVHRRQDEMKKSYHKHIQRQRAEAKRVKKI